LLVAIDVVAASLAALVAFALRFNAPSVDGVRLDITFGLLLPLAWVLAVMGNGAYERRFVGVGNAEFERVFRAFLHLTVVTVFVFYAADAPVARGYAFPALGFALLFDLASRYAARKWLHRRRQHGRSMSSVVAIGGVASVAQFTALLRRDRYAGLEVVGACLPQGSARGGDGERELDAIGVPVVGDVDSIVDVVHSTGAHTVAVLSGEISAEKLRWISWQLEGTDTDLVVSPGLTEVAGRRLEIQPVAGLPLLHVKVPAFTGVRRMIKGGFDRFVAGLALLLLSPIMLALGALVVVTSKGSPLFLQTRVGRDGQTFRMIKFRSMYTGAERRVSELLSQNQNADGLLFKVKDDPRVTPIGRRLRRYSLDELPQLINVLLGSMSLVGPRPPLPSEVAQYQDDVRRRLLVKPGLTGLWQISGRSDLSWEESVRLDLRYVENWSLATDLMILWKTTFAVVRSAGAY
jgi:exopolysaccharide biosynthesis polyprenyl glycosylphosphotransferase